uniref:ShKT domain-containing protein n=1 Tax=Syphacia muris TaxID=451379 RepID=A0A0N5AHB8_9BILA
MLRYMVLTLVVIFELMTLTTSTNYAAAPSCPYGLRPGGPCESHNDCPDLGRRCAGHLHICIKNRCCSSCAAM